MRCRQSRTTRKKSPVTKGFGPDPSCLGDSMFTEFLQTQNARGNIDDFFHVNEIFHEENRGKATYYVIRKAD
jgi:hypothetical protein